MTGRFEHARPRHFVLALAAAAVGSLALAEPSLAASEVGRNVGKEVESWAKYLMMGVVGLVAIPVIAKRDLAAGLVVTLLATLVGGFVFAPNAVKDVIGGIWKAIAG